MVNLKVFHREFIKNLNEILSKRFTALVKMRNKIIRCLKTIFI